MDLNAILNKAIQNLQEDDDMISAGVDGVPDELSQAAQDAQAARAAQAAQAVADAGGAKTPAGESPAQLTPAQKAMIKIDQAQEWAKANPALAAGVPAALLAGAGALALRRRQLAARGR